MAPESWVADPHFMGMVTFLFHFLLKFMLAIAIKLMKLSLSIVRRLSLTLGLKGSNYELIFISFKVKNYFGVTTVLA